MNKGKLAQVRALLDKWKADGLLLTQQKNVSWFISGRSHVNIASEPACCNVLITGRGCVLIANNIEAKRLLEEESAASFTSEQIWNWYEPETKYEFMKEQLPRIKYDTECEADFLQLRSVFAADEWDEWRNLGRLTAEAIEQTAQEIKKGESEFQIAGRLASQCYERELEPIVNLVAVDERAYTRRHPQPTGKRLESYAMIVVCARKKGLIASATRLVHFGKPGEELLQKMNKVAEIDARIIDATKPGKNLGTIYNDIKRFYQEAGFPDEYRMHHQGGLTGYATREKMAAPQELLTVEQGQLYAWNPSIAGVKSEDTFLLTPEGPENITMSGNYPQIEVEVGNIKMNRSSLLQR